MTDVLVLYWHPDGVQMRPAIEHHLRALETYAAQGTVHYLNSFNETRPPRALRVSAVILHTTFLTQRWGDWFGLFKQDFDWLADLECTKIAIPQDEYDHCEVLDEWLYELGVDTVFTNFAASERQFLYRIPDTRRRYVECLTGYIDPQVADRIRAHGVRPLGDRPIDVVYRASNLPYWFGRHGQTKGTIGTVTAEACRRLGLTADISTSYDDVITGDAWFEFLASGRAVVGTESGSGAIDRRGEIQTALRAMLAREADLSFAEAVGRIPDGWDGYPLTAISPRHFEAVITSTAQILVRGSYSGVLRAEEHYIPVEPDLSDLDDALLRVRDIGELERVTRQAYDDIYLSGEYTYETFAQKLAAEAYGGLATATTPVAADRNRQPRRERSRPLPRLPRMPRFRSPIGPVKQALARVARALDAISRLMLRVAAVKNRLAMRARLASAVGNLLLTRADARRVALTALVRGCGGRTIARDFLRLAIIGSNAGAPGAGWQTVLERRGDTLALVSSASPANGSSVPPEPTRLTAVVWDHSALGPTVPFLPGDPADRALSLEETGVYEFASLSAVASGRSGLVLRAVASVVRRA